MSNLKSSKPAGAKDTALKQAEAEISVQEDGELKQAEAVQEAEIEVKHTNSVEQEGGETNQAEAVISVQKDGELKQANEETAVQEEELNQTDGETLEQAEVELKEQDHHLVTSERQQQRQVKQAPSKGNDSKEHRKDIPFNVLMLPTDRRRKQENQEQKKERVPMNRHHSNCSYIQSE